MRAGGVAVSDGGGPRKGGSEPHCYLLRACPGERAAGAEPSGGASDGQEQGCHGAGVLGRDRNGPRRMGWAQLSSAGYPFLGLNFLK